MGARALKRWQMAIVEEFDAGERSLAKLAETHEYSVGGVRNILLRAGRTPPSMSEARKKALADPEVRARMSEATKKAWAKRRTCPAEFKPFYTKLRQCGLSREEALDAVEAEALARETRESLAEAAA